METTLENKLKNEKVGYIIHTLVKRGRINQAAELAYQEFGFKRAFKIYFNAANVYGCRKFAEEKGIITEFNSFCQDYNIKIGSTKELNRQQLDFKNSLKKAQRGLETEIEV